MKEEYKKEYLQKLETNILVCNAVSGKSFSRLLGTVFILLGYILINKKVDFYGIYFEPNQTVISILAPLFLWHYFNTFVTFSSLAEDYAGKHMSVWGEIAGLSKEEEILLEFPSSATISRFRELEGVKLFDKIEYVLIVMIYYPFFFVIWFLTGYFLWVAWLDSGSLLVLSYHLVLFIYSIFLLGKLLILFARTKKRQEEKKKEC